MSGTLGDFVVGIGPASVRRVAALDDAAHWPPAPVPGQRIEYLQAAPGIHLWRRGDVSVHARPRGGIGLSLEPAQGRERAQERDGLARPLADWAVGGDFEPLRLRGRFAFVGWDAATGKVLACTDSFRTCPLYWAEADGVLWLASDLRLVAHARGQAPAADLRALYQYLNYSYIPAPRTGLQGISKLPAGWQLRRQDGTNQLGPYWDARYPSDLPDDEALRVAELRRHIVGTVEAYRPGDHEGWGAFLSGGTDSSSICGILSRAHPTPVNSFSIGFDEDGYDELGYSRIASQAFGLKAHEYRVNESDSVAAIPDLARIYDEPFGNSSAIPTYYCARLAADAGVTRLLAGDGGDEIFGGNERYRKDAIFEMFHHAPAPARWMGQALATTLGPVDSRWANRVKNFVHRASLPNPDRFYSDDSFASDHFDTLLTERVRGAVKVDDALDVQRQLYAQAQAAHSLHRLMYLDLKMTIADNDAVKVVKATRMAGVDVAFPFLDRTLVDFTGRLPVKDKLRGKHKRYLFKRAADDILPEAIRNKKKQGFGLPISVWLRRGGAYHDMVHDVLLSPRCLQRGYIQESFLRGLIDRHVRGAWDHAMEIHMLLMLELWHREQVDGHGT